MDNENSALVCRDHIFIVLISTYVHNMWQTFYIFSKGGYPYDVLFSENNSAVNTLAQWG